MNAAFQLPDTAHPLIRTAFDYWRHIRPANVELPGRQHFDPLHIPHLLPHVWLVDVLEGTPLVFRYRILGTAVDRGMGQTLTGKYMHAVIPGFYAEDHLWGPYNTVVQKAAPSYRLGPPLFQHNQQYKQLERILMPLARNGQRPDMLFCCTLFYGADGQLLGARI